MYFKALSGALSPGLLYYRCKGVVKNVLRMSLKIVNMSFFNTERKYAYLVTYPITDKVGF
jgi:hypothetical protein